MSDRIPQAECIDLFGETMPIEAASLMFTCPDEMTVAELRAKMREMAAEWKAKQPPGMTDAEIEAAARSMCVALGLGPDDRVGCGWYDHETPGERAARVKRQPEGSAEPDMLCFKPQWQMYRWKAAEAIVAAQAMREEARMQIELTDNECEQVAQAIFDHAEVGFEPISQVATIPELDSIVAIALAEINRILAQRDASPPASEPPTPSAQPT